MTPHALEVSLENIVNTLIAQKFHFISESLSTCILHEQITTYDKYRSSMSNTLFKLFMGGGDQPEFINNILKYSINFTVNAVTDSELVSLKNMITNNFPISAITFSKIYGPRFVTVVMDDNLSETDFQRSIDNFTQINFHMLELGGRLALGIFGRKLFNINSSSSTGSMIIVTASTSRAELLRQWIHNTHIHNDTAISQLKELAGRWQFWAKAAIGMMEFKPNQLRQEIIVLDTQAKHATSSSSPRLPFEFGFSLNNIVSYSDALARA